VASAKRPADLAPIWRPQPQGGPNPVRIWEVQPGRQRPDNFRDTMRFAFLCVAAAVAFLSVAASSGFAQSTDAKTSDPRSPNGDNGKEGQKKVDDYAEAERLLGAPAGNPECVWLGKRVISLLWRDDLDTAYRHLDLYDRFGCPGGNIQIAFRCLVHGPQPDSKTPLDGRASDCWLKSGDHPGPAEAAASAPAQAQ
jgi:hypothetical protein